MMQNIGTARDTLKSVEHEGRLRLDDFGGRCSQGMLTAKFM